MAVNVDYPPDNLLIRHSIEDDAHDHAHDNNCVEI